MVISPIFGDQTESIDDDPQRRNWPHDPQAHPSHTVRSRWVPPMRQPHYSRDPGPNRTKPPRPPCDNYLRNPDLTPHLERLIALSSRPMLAIETGGFGFDATGMRGPLLIFEEDDGIVGK